MNYSNEELEKMDEKKVYMLVLNGELTRFPKGYFSLETEECKKRRSAIVRYLIEERFQLKEEEIKKLKSSFFINNRLSGIIRGRTVIGVINEAYPGKYKPWEFMTVEDNYWNKDTAKEATKWLFDEKLKWNKEEILKNTSRKVFAEYGLDSMTYIVFNRNIYYTLENAYPGRFKAWEFPYLPKKYWNNDNIREATRWLIEEKLCFSRQQVKNKLTLKHFQKYGLRGITKNRKLYEILEIAYPGEYRKDDLHKHLYDYNINVETAREATRLLIEEKLKWDEEQILKSFSCDLLKKNGLEAVVKFFNFNIYDIVDNAYPGRFKPWEFNNIPVKAINEDMVKEAVKNLYENELKLLYYQIPQNVSYELFEKYHLIRLVDILFDGDIKEAVRVTYPNLIIR